MIKLHLLDELADGTQRFQSQLYIGRQSVDFIKRKEDSIMRCWGQGKGGFNFHPYNKPYEIVTNVKQMRTQTL